MWLLWFNISYILCWPWKGNPWRRLILSRLSNIYAWIVQHTWWRCWGFCAWFWQWVWSLGIRGFVEDALVGVVVERINLELNLSPPSSSSAPLVEIRPTHVRTIHKRILRWITPNPSPRLPDAARASLRQTEVSGSTSQVSIVWTKALSRQHILQEHV